MKQRRRALKFTPKPAPEGLPAATGTGRYLKVFAYFVSYRETQLMGNVVRLRNMVLRVPGPIRDTEQIQRVEGMLEDAAVERIRKESGRPPIIGEKLAQITVLALNVLDVWDEEMSMEEMALVQKRNEEIQEQRELQRKAGEIVEELKGKDAAKRKPTRAH